MTQVLRTTLCLATLSMALAACSAVGATGQGVSTAGNALSGAATGTQQQVHQATGAATK